jgi:hypothetical protein
VELAYPVSSNTVRVAFTDPPVCVLKTGTHDVLFRENWSVRNAESTTVRYRVLSVTRVTELLFDIHVDKDLGHYATPHIVSVNNVKSVLGHVASQDVRFNGMLSVGWRTDGDFYNRGVSNPADGAPGTFVRTAANDIARHYGAAVVEKAVRRFISTPRDGSKIYDVSGVRPNLKDLVSRTDVAAIEREIRREYGDVKDLAVTVTLDEDYGTLLISVNGVVYTVKE